MVLIAKSKKPNSAHHKKRSGQHHTRTKPYTKPYWPYLPLLGVVGFGFLLNMLWLQPGGSVLAYATSMTHNALLQETNAQRVSAGQQGLLLNAQLNAAAQAKANDMASRNYWSHVTPDGVQPWWFVTNAGYDYESTGENLAYGFDTSLATVTGWMNSSGHRANILNAGYKDVGFGIVNANSYQGQGQQTIVVALYGSPAVLSAATSVEPPAATTPAPNRAPSGIAQAAPATATPAAQAPATNTQNPSPASPVTPSAANQTTTPAGNTISQTAAVAATNVNTPTIVTDDASQPISRMQLAAANVSTWQVFAVTVIVAIAAGIFILRHMVFWHRAIVKGEHFLVKHWKLDLVILVVIVSGVVVTRTAGFIQ